MAHRLPNLIRTTKKPAHYVSCRLLSSHFYPIENEYVTQPIYPPILDTSRKAKWERTMDGIAKTVTDQPTVEEKLIQMNEPKYYGFWSCKLVEQVLIYNALPFVQFATRTTVSSGLPQSHGLEERASNLLPQLKEKVQEVIVQETESAGSARERSRNLNIQINRLLTNYLISANQDLASVDVDIDPRVEAYWFLGGLPADRILKVFRKMNNWPKDCLDEPCSRSMQYKGKPCLTLRHHKPLPQLLARDAELCKHGEIPEWNLDPRVLGFKYRKSRASCVPGFWPGAASQYGYLSILSRDHIPLRDKLLGNRDHDEGLLSQAVLHSFAWTLGQACYLGFGPYTELTYPLTTQTIISDGQYFSFYQYQLNTCALYDRFSGEANPFRNVCFYSNEAKLYETVENGQVKGFNDQVLSQLIQSYLVNTVDPVADSRPYLSAERYIANVTDDKRRKHVEETFKHLTSNRPRHLPEEEIYDWERIYKISHQTRPMDAKRRFFETQQDVPGRRRLFDHNPAYIPRDLRDPPKKSRRGRLPKPVTVKL